MRSNNTETPEEAMSRSRYQPEGAQPSSRLQYETSTEHNYWAGKYASGQALRFGIESWEDEKDKETTQNSNRMDAMLQLNKGKEMLGLRSDGSTKESDTSNTSLGHSGPGNTVPGLGSSASAPRLL